MNASRPLSRVLNCAGRVSACARLDFGLTVKFACWRIVIPLMKRVVNVSVLAELLKSRASALGDDVRQRRVDSIKRIATTGGRLLVSRNCLTRSLTLYRLLSVTGAQPVLLLGARNDGIATRGHAWVELEGKPFPKPDDEVYSPIVGFDEQGARAPSRVQSPA